MLQLIRYKHTDGLLSQNKLAASCQCISQCCLLLWSYVWMLSAWTCRNRLILSSYAHVTPIHHTLSMAKCKCMESRIILLTMCWRLAAVAKQSINRKTAVMCATFSLHERFTTVSSLQHAVDKFQTPYICIEAPSLFAIERAWVDGRNYSVFIYFCSCRKHL